MNALNPNNEARFNARRRRWRTGSTVAVVGVLSVSLAGGVALAKAKQDAARRADALGQVSQESAVAMRDIRAARLAIFEGEPDAAKHFIADAQQQLSAAEKSAPRTKVTVKTEQTVGNKTVAKSEASETTELVPIDAWLGVAEDFVSTPAKQASIAKADQHIKAGGRSQALETLKAADIDVSVTRVLMPVGATERQVARAADLLSHDKYYEANLALKVAEDGLITDSVLLYQPTEAPAHAS